jgi:hypothetical protein
MRVIIQRKDAENFNTWETQAEDHKFKVSLGYLVKPCLKKQKEREGERDQVFNRGTL